jgi:YidC/Oxa1 family membrane protein insertase
MAIVIGYYNLQVAILGKPEPVDEVAKDAAAEDAVDIEEIEKPVAPPADAEIANGVAGADADEPTGGVALPAADDRDQAAEEAAAIDDAPPPDEPLRHISLGSLDPDSDKRILVTFTNQGAAIERIELNSPRFRDLDDTRGYLGHLACTDDPAGGCRIGVVGAATPAALATSENGPVGLQGPHFETDATGQTRIARPGDRIVEFDGDPINSVAELQLALGKTRPGQKVTISVQRPGDNENSTRLSYETTLIERPLEVVRPESLGGSEDPPHDPLSFLFTLSRIGDRSIVFGEDEMAGLPSLQKSNWSVDEDRAAQSVEFRRRLTPAELQAVGAQGAIEIIKHYRVMSTTESDEHQDAKGYLILFDIEIHNRGNAPQVVSYQLDGPTGLPLEGWWYSSKIHPSKWGAAGARDVVWSEAGDKLHLLSTGDITKQAKNEPKNPDKPLIDSGDPVPLRFIGCDTQFFAAILTPANSAVNPSQDDSTSNFLVDTAVARAVGSLDEERSKRTNVTFRFRSMPETIQAGASFRQDFAIFAGPKDRQVLEQVGLQDVIVYGWFGKVSRPLVWVLHKFYGIVRNYGIAIILLTVMVRGAMFPLGRKMAVNAQKMQELAPEMKKIAEKYKNDMEKRSQAQRELFTKNNYNPFSGCLLMFLQLPIFIGLYRGLSTDIALRQAPLIPGIAWCSNLAGPDHFLDWSSWLPSALSAPTGWLGPYMNILPFVTVVLFMLHQKLFTPPPTDDQQKMQQQIMKVMMLFMGVMFHKVAAGLCIYFIASSLWGLAERLLLPKPKTPVIAGATAAAAAPVAAAAGSNGKSGAARRKKKAKRKR